MIRRLIFILTTLFFLGIPFVSFANDDKFKIEHIPKNLQDQMTAFKTWEPKCPLPPERLRLVKFAYYDFAEKEQNNGQIIVMDAAADRILNVFRELHTVKFPIAKALPIEYYKGSDEDAMIDNNTSSFCCRQITGGGPFSIHSYGLAIDLNPIQNPYISFRDSIKILPPAGKDYINRTNHRPGMVETVQEIFKKNGFYVWGGAWNGPIDWQHFQTPRPVAQLLAAMVPKDALAFFEIYSAAESFKIFEPVKDSNDKLVELYREYPEKFMSVFHNHKEIFNLDSKQAYDLILAEVARH